MLRDLSRIEADDFRQFIGQPFRVTGSEGTLDLELVAVTARSEFQPNPTARIPFSLEFRAAAGPPRPQRTYLLENAGFGAVHLFIVPCKIDRSGCYYHAVIN
jgi:hypothetical protein